MVKTKLIFFLLVLNGCNSTLFDEPCKSDCSINIYSELPQDEDGVYILNWNPNLVMTYSHLYVETECGLHTKVSWDSDYQFEIVEDQWISLINPSSMTNEQGEGTIVYGVWSPFIGETITLYGGYVDDCDNHFVDSVKVFVQ